MSKTPHLQANLPAWLSGFLSAGVMSGSARHFLVRGASLGEVVLCAPVGQIGDMTFRTAPPHRPCNLIIAQSMLASSEDLEAMAQEVGRVRTTTEYRLLLVVDSAFLRELADAWPFVSCIDTLCDHLAGVLARPCLVEATGPSGQDDTKLNNFGALSVMMFWVFG